MCDDPTTAVFCKLATECFPGIISIFFKPSVTIPVAPMTTDMMRHFTLTVFLQSDFLHFNLPSVSPFLLSFLFLIIMSGTSARTYLFVPLTSTVLLHLHVHILG